MDETLDDFAFHFFKIYAKYEYYLKANHYVQRIGTGKRFNVDWDRFVNQKIGSEYIALLGENSDSANYILDNPPSSQVVNTDGVIVWEPVKNNEQNVQILFGHISRVRNNMFHGGKFNGTWFDPDRNHLLLMHCLVVLEAFKHLAEIE
mgnify:CR=1 FL=1